MNMYFRGKRSDNGEWIYGSKIMIDGLSVIGNIFDNPELLSI